MDRDCIGKLFGTQLLPGALTFGGQLLPLPPAAASCCLLPR